jgi:superfamily II DNA or RNA helicase/transcriptional regulator with XRE-family HTH domain
LARSHNPIPPDFSQRIKYLRSQAGLTQTALARLIGVTPAAVNQWESGGARPSARFWRRIVQAEALGVASLGQGNAAQGVMKEEAAAYTVGSVTAPDLDFAADPEIVRIVAEGQRLAYGHLFNPTFAAETSLIDPLPHQRIAVYEHMLPQTRLRFLLADDAGAGKTIMAGLYIREMLARRLVRRILIVPPAGLVSNWERELRSLFNLPFRVVGGGEARDGNPFDGPDSDLLIVSVDTLGGERTAARLQEPSIVPYDLAVFDEAHKLSADREQDFRIRKTDRYRLAEALAGVRGDDPRWQLDWGCTHLLLLTATPHMGKDFPYYCLWQLLEPEILSTFDAFTAYPADARRRHFIRRTKEEMVRFDGTPIYPMRVSDTLSFDLTAGEQRLYDETTAYIDDTYNRARILNRSAARLAMSIFQRRLASSTYALLRSLERRLARLEALIDDIRSGRLTMEQLIAMQRGLSAVADPLDEMTADEETPEDGREENEAAEEQALAGVVALTLAELEGERLQVKRLVDMARQTNDQDQSKFDKLREVLHDPRFAQEKVIIFTEHRDTLLYLVRQLEGLGFTGQVAQIHGGMSARPDPQTRLSERDEQVEFFRRPAEEGGARFLVATDAAGEGINLQFCWLMVNYDIPWNPARLEQRMGRIHRYKQAHDPVVIINLLAGQTREGRVLKTLLDKLERIRKELGSDKVFDVVGRLFEGVSLRDYMLQALTEGGAEAAEHAIQGTLTKEQVLALQAREERLYGAGGDVRPELPRLQERLSQEVYRRLLPGYVRRFVEKAAPLVDIGLDYDAQQITFALRPLKAGALDALWPALEAYPTEQRDRLIFDRPDLAAPAIFMHPGEALFDRLCAAVCARFARQALRGGVFVDPTAAEPYLFHLALIEVCRQADPDLPALARPETLELRLAGLRQSPTGEIQPASVESLLLLRAGGGLSAAAIPIVATARDLRELARAHVVDQVAFPLAEEHRQGLLQALPERAGFLGRGFDYQEAELAAARSRLADKARGGDRRAKGELTRIKTRQQKLAEQRDLALARLRREPELIVPGEVTFLAHALVLPSSDPEDRQRHDDAVEAVAVQVARAYEEAAGATVKDVSTPALALRAGLGEHPGFDLHSRRPDGAERCIEVKGRAAVGDVDVSENEWAKACNLRERYWLYVVYGCAGPRPQLQRVPDPFGSLLVRARGGVMIDEQEIFAAAEAD